MNDQIKEILSYLEKRNDYLIWAGFAKYAYLEGEYSADVDIFTDTPETKRDIIADFQKLGWQVPTISTIRLRWDWNRSEKGGTTFDVVYSPRATQLIIPEKVELIVEGYKLQFISKEWLYLTKLGQLIWKGRSEEKRQRDIQAVLGLEDLIDAQKIVKFVSQLPACFWKEGEIQD